MRPRSGLWLPRLAFAFIALGLALLALGYWGPWLPHPAAGLNILGIDLAEYVKFVPEVQSGQISLRREVFYNPLITLSLGFVLLATVKRPRLPRLGRLLILVLAIPTALAMLPPAWTPALLRTAEFRQQTVAIAMLFGAVLLSPLLRRSLPDWGRGILLLILGCISFPALAAFLRLLTALSTLYHRPVAPGPAFYLAGIGAGLIAVGGLLLAANWRGERQAERAANAGSSAG